MVTDSGSDVDAPDNDSLIHHQFIREIYYNNYFHYYYNKAYKVVDDFAVDYDLTEHKMSDDSKVQTMFNIYTDQTPTAFKNSYPNNNKLNQHYNNKINYSDNFGSLLQSDSCGHKKYYYNNSSYYGRRRKIECGRYYSSFKSASPFSIYDKKYNFKLGFNSQKNVSVTANSSSVDGRLNGMNDTRNNLDNQEEKFQPSSDSHTRVNKKEKPDIKQEGAVVEETKVNDQAEHEVENNSDLKIEEVQSSLEKVKDSKLDESSSVNGESEVNKNKTTNENHEKNLIVSVDEQDSEINDDIITSTSALSSTLTSKISSSAKDSSSVEESSSPVDDCEDENNCDSLTCEEVLLEIEDDKLDEVHVVEELGDEEIEEEDDIIHIESAKMETVKTTSSDRHSEKSKPSKSATKSGDDSLIEVDEDIDKSKINESSELNLTESNKDKSVEDKVNNIIVVKSLTKLTSNSEPDTTEPGTKRRLISPEDSLESPNKKIFRDNSTISSSSSSSTTTKQSEKDQTDTEDIDIDENNANEDIVEIHNNAAEVDDASKNDSPKKTPKNGEVLSNVDDSADCTTQDVTNGLETQNNDSLVTEMDTNERSSTERQSDAHPRRKLRRKKRRSPSSVKMAVHQGQGKKNF